MVAWIAGDTITAALLNAMMPVGTILLYGGTSAPTGWLLCNGAAVSRTTYSELFAVTGTAYGTGDGSTTFNVPDFLGRTVIGTGSGSGLTTRARGDKSGEETHVLTTAEMPAHTHNSIIATAYHQVEWGNNDYWGPGATSSVGSDGAHENMPPFGVATYIIKT